MANSILVSINDVKDELDMKPTEDQLDDILQDRINGIASHWEERTERQWESGERTEIFDGDAANNGKLFVKNVPITAVSGIWDDPDWAFPDSSKLATADITYDAVRGIVYYKGSFNHAFQNIKVIYTAGYTAPNVPKWLTLLLARQVAHWQRQSAGDTAAVSSVSISAGGGTTSYKSLVDNLLPEFAKAIEEHRWSL